MISVLNKDTGEIIELQNETLADAIFGWQIAKEYERISKEIKDKLKPLVRELSLNGKSEEHKGLYFQVSNVQRKQYDKAVVRQYLDEDTYDLFVKIDKGGLDKYIKENLNELGDISTKLRESMIADGQPYETIRLTKLERS